MTRIILDTGFRMVYPFLPTFARALGVDISAISLAITARATLMATSITAAADGQALGAFIGPALFEINMLENFCLWSRDGNHRTCRPGYLGQGRIS